MTSRCDRFRAAQALRHPLFWGSAAVLALNDHILKGAGLLPDVITGKLSDAAGLLVAPVLLAVVFRARSRVAVAACHVVVLAAMAWLKLSPAFAAGVVAAAELVGETWSIMADPTDLLVAIPAAIASWWLLARPSFSASGAKDDAAVRSSSQHPASLGTREIVLVGLAALACGATSRTPPQAPAIDRGRVIAGPWAEDETYVIDRSGRALRKLEVPSGDPPAVFRGALWSLRNEGDSGTKIVAIELDTGRVRKMQLPRYVEASRVEAVDAQSVYVRGYCAPITCGRSSRFTAIDLATDRVRWTSSSDWGADIVVGEGIAAVNEGERLVVRDVSGSILYTRTLRNRGTPLGLANGVLWVGDARGTLLALSARDGAVRGTWELGDRAGAMAPESGPMHHRSAAVGDRLYLAVDDRIRAFALDTPKPVWERPGRAVTATEGVVVIENLESNLTGLDPASGDTTWQSTRAVWGTFAVGDGIVARREGDAYVGILDARTGRLLSRFDLEDGVPAGE